MSHQTILDKIIDKMLEYQKNNNITKMCVTNTQILYDIFKRYTKYDVKAKAIIVLYIDEIDEYVMTYYHLVLQVNDNIIDPSYEVNKLKCNYYENVKTMLDNLKHNKLSIVQLEKKENIKELIQKHIEFTQLAERINNGIFTITEKEYYNNICDYISLI